MLAIAGLTMLMLAIFGRFRASDGSGHEVFIKSKKARALLAYLALPLGKPRSREEIMALLWSDRGDEQARGSLRQALSGLRRDLGEELSQALRIADDAIALDPEQVAVAKPASGETLLEGLHINDAAFDEWLRDERLRLESEQPAGREFENMPLALPDKPSIAVLPFANMSDEPDQKYFADGVTEDIVTTLAKTPKLFVVNRDSTLKYKDEAYDPKHVGQEQGVQYLLEGSVRRGGNRLRISAKLIEAASGHHVWADRYDRVVDDVFALQDEITREIILALQVKLTDGERARIFARGTKNFEAWELVFQAGGLLNNHDREDTAEARRLICKALQIDEHYALAHTFLGWAYWMEAHDGWTDTPERSLDLALDAARRAQAIDPDDGEVHPLLAMIHVSNRDYDRAEEEIQRATTLGPNNSKAFSIAAVVANYCGNPAQAVTLMRQAMRLCPVYYAWFPGSLAEAHFLLHDLDDAESACRMSLACDPDYIHARITLAVTLAEMGRTTEARAETDKIMRIDPNFSIGVYMRGQTFRDDQVTTRMIEGLRMAGFPE
jgi:adenylate cyclase